MCLLPVSRPSFEVGRDVNLPCSLLMQRRAHSRCSIRAHSRRSIRAHSRCSIKAHSMCSIRAHSRCPIRAHSRYPVRAHSSCSVRAHSRCSINQSGTGLGAAGALAGACQTRSGGGTGTQGLSWVPAQSWFPSGDGTHEEEHLAWSMRGGTQAEAASGPSRGRP